MRLGVELFGGVRVTVDGAPVDFGGRRPRAILAALTLADRHVLSVDRLIDLVWDVEHPRTARRTLQSHVAGLRRALGGEASPLSASRAGYVLEVDRGDVDLFDFADTVARAKAAVGSDPAMAAADLSRALDAWRVPLDGLRPSPSLQALVAPYEQLRLEALELLNDVELHHVDVGAAVARLEMMVREQPLRERFWAQLAEGLATLGRRDEALRAIQRAREALRVQLGVSLSPLLQDLEREILDGSSLAGGAAMAQPHDRQPSPTRAGRTALPSGVVTFVMTDVVGSTRLWQESPATMDAALGRHGELIEAAVAGHLGAVLRARGEGDSTFSVFGRASDAVRAAVQAQRGLRAEAWPEGTTVSVRIAIHSGEAVERGDDYLGSAVNRAARLRDLASGGDILLTGTTADLVVDDLPADVDLVEVGPIRLRDLDRAERVFGLVADGILPPATALRRDPDMSRREADVLDLVGEGLTNAEIAAHLYISKRIVDSHVSSLLRKLGAADRHALVRHATTSSAGEAQPSLPLLPPALELLADAASFVGRAAEREVLRRQWQLVRAGHTLLVLVTAEAGMGKSRLLSELAVEAHADGGRVLLGACYEDIDQPYAPFAQAIASDAAHFEPGELRRRAGDERDALSRLSPALADALVGAGKTNRTRGVDASERGAMLDGIRQWLTASASSAPLLLAIEDLHWSTSTTRDVLRHLVRRAGREPLLVVATARDTAPDLDVDLIALFAELERSPAVTRVVLDGLDRDDVAALVGVDADSAMSIVTETGGNPLLVTHVKADGRGGSLPELLTRPDGLLDDETRAVLDLAATFGAEFDADLLAAGQGAPLLSVLESLERAEAAGLVLPLPGRRGQFGFVHALFRSHRYHRLPLRRRLELHAKAAKALATRPGDDRSLAERARHACLAVPLSDARTAVDLAREAGHVAEHAYAYDEAVTHYRRGLAAARSLEPADSRTSLELTVRLAAALHHHSDPQGLPMLINAARQARRDGDHAALVRAATQLSRFGMTVVFGEPDPAQLAVIEQALEVLGNEPTADRARLLIELAGHISDVRVDESIELATEAESIARHLGDDDVLGHVLLGARNVGRHPSRRTEFERIGVELERLGHRLGSLALTLAGINTRAIMHLEQGELGPWMEAEERAARLLGDRSLRFFQWNGPIYLANRAFLDGDLQRAEDLALSTWSLATALGIPPQVFIGSTMLISRRLQARDAELIETIEPVYRGEEVSVVQCCLTAVQARAGCLDDAVHGLNALRSRGYAVKRHFGWTVAMAELAEAAEVAGDPETAAHVLGETGAYSGLIAAPGAGVNRPLDQALAQAALAVGDTALAEQYALGAVAASRQRKTPVYLCRELVFLAEARRRAGAAPDEVRPFVAEAVVLAERIGARVVAVDIERYGLPT